MKNTINNITNLVRGSVAALMMRASAFQEDARKMEEAATKEELVRSIPFVLIQDNLKRRESFANLSDLALHIGADPEDLVDIVLHRNGIYGAFIMHEASCNDSSFAVA